MNLLFSLLAWLLVILLAVTLGVIFGATQTLAWFRFKVWLRRWHWAKIAAWIVAFIIGVGSWMLLLWLSRLL